MSKSVFISGSISIKLLPNKVIESLNRIIANDITVLVGDADGVDLEVQKFFAYKKYTNVTVYSIYSQPRNLSSKSFKTKTIEVQSDIKSERVRQSYKDEAMSDDCDYGLIIWDEKSNGSYENIKRLIDLNKSTKIYSSKKEDFLSQSEVTPSNIDSLYDANNGITASKVVRELMDRDITLFRNAMDLNRYLMEQNVVKKIEGTYLPTDNNEAFVVVSHNRGRVSSKYSTEIIDFIERRVRSESLFYTTRN